MAFVHGKNTVFSIQDSANTLRNISAFLNSVSFSQEAGTAEVTTFGKASKDYLAGLKDATISIEGSWDSVVDGYLNGILGFATLRTFEYGPEGSTTGKIKYSGSGILTSYEPDSPLDDAATFSSEFQISGTITRGTYA